MAVGSELGVDVSKQALEHRFLRVLLELRNAWKPFVTLLRIGRGRGHLMNGRIRGSCELVGDDGIWPVCMFGWLYDKGQPQRMLATH